MTSQVLSIEERLAFLQQELDSLKQDKNDHQLSIANQFAAFQQLQGQFEHVQSQFEKMNQDIAKDKVSMVVFSGSLDRILAAFVIATGAAAMGSEVAMFFTFWGTPVMRASKKSVKKSDIFAKMFGWMLPRGTTQLKLSQMNMGGMGTTMMKHLMNKKNISSLDEMLEMAGEMGVNIRICEMSMDLMGMKREEMIDYPELSYCGVAKFLEDACESKSTLFI